MEQKDKIEKMKGKIAKILKKAEGAKDVGSIEEATNFILQANRLLMKYNIELDDLDLSEEIVDEIMHESFTLNEVHRWNKSDGDWMFYIYHMTSQINLCSIIKSVRKEFVRDQYTDEIILNSKGDGKIRTVGKVSLFGTEINQEITKYMSTSIINQLKRLSKQAWKEYLGSEREPTWKRGYFRGAVDTLRKVFNDYKEAQKEEFPSVTALVLTNQVALKSKVEEVFGRTGRSKSRAVSGMGGYNLGQRDGSKVTIRKGISKGYSNNQNRLIIMESLKPNIMIQTLEEKAPTLEKGKEHIFFIIKKGNKKYVTIRNNELGISKLQKKAILFKSIKKLEDFISNATIDSRNDRVIGNSYFITDVTIKK